jgi:hypothetical protein
MIERQVWQSSIINLKSEITRAVASPSGGGLPRETQGEFCEGSRRAPTPGQPTGRQSPTSAVGSTEENVSSRTVERAGDFARMVDELEAATSQG